jgi:hypothetical protein
MDDALLKLSGAQEASPDKWTALATVKFIAGLQTQRSAFASIDTRYNSKFLGGKPDALLAGVNVEISNKLTLQRRPGVQPYGISNIPSPTAFYDWDIATTGDIILVVDTEAPGGDNVALTNGAVFNYSPTSSGIYVNKAALSKQTNFTSVANTLYMGDGVDLLKIVGPNLLTQSNTFGIGAGTSFTIQSPWTESDVFALTGGQSDPLGTSTATQVIWSTTGSAAYVQQIAGPGDAVTGANTPNYTPVANNTFTFSIWMIQTGGTESITISIRDQAGVIASKVCVLTTSWQKFQITGTMLNTSTEVIVRIGSPTTTNAMNIYGAQLEVGGPATTTQITTTKPQGVYLWGILAPVAAPTLAFANQTGSTGKPWQPDHAYLVGDTIVDSNGNLEYATNGGTYPGTVGSSAGTSGTSAPAWNTQIGGFTLDGLQNFIVQAITSTSSTVGTGTSASVTMPAAVTAGNQLLVAVYVSHPQVINVADSVSDTFVSVLSNGKGGHQPPNSGDSNYDCVYQGQFTLYLFFVASAVGGTTTINVTGGGLSGTYIAAAELSDLTGLDTGGSAINSNATGSNAGGFFTTGGITTTNADDIIFSVYAGAVSASVGPGSEIGVTPTGYQTVTSDAGVPFASQTALFNLTMAFTSVTKASFYNPDWAITNPTAKSQVVGITASLKTTVGTLQWYNLGPTGAGLTTVLGYQYYMAFGNSYTGHISNVSPISANTGVITGQIVSVTGATRTMATSGTYSTDPQSDLIYLFRNTDGGAFFFQLAVFGNGSTAQADLLAAGYPGLSTSVTYGSGTFTFADTTADANLNTALFAPIGLLNSLPPAGLKDMDYFAGRMWGSVGNLLYFNTAADNATLLSVTQNGVPSESWIPDNVIPFNAQITRIVAVGGGLLVATVLDVWFVTGQNLLQGGFNPIKVLIGHGVRSYNGVGVDGSSVWVYTSDRQCLNINPNSGSVEMGFPIGDFLEENFSPLNAIFVRHVSGSQDNAVFFADGTTGWFRLNPNQVGASMSGEQTPVWSPKADFTATLGGLGIIASIETSAGETQLLAGLPAYNTSGIANVGPVLVRNLTIFSDNGAAYEWSATIGSILLANAGKNAEVDSITTEMNNSTAPGIIIATQCGVGVLCDEIAGAFESLPIAKNDPPGLAPSVTVLSNRFYLSQGGQCPTLRHMQVQLTGGAQTTKDELLALTIRGALVPETI